MENWRIVYEIFIFIWVLFGLGYLFMIITVISDGLSFPAKQAAKKLKTAERQLVTKILTEVMNRRGMKADTLDGMFERKVTNITLVNEYDEDENQAVTDAAPPHNVNQEEANTEGDAEVSASDAGIVVESKNHMNSTSSVDGFLEELNHDTITSLHNFMSSALYVQRGMRQRKATPPAMFPSQQMSLRNAMHPSDRGIEELNIPSSNVSSIQPSNTCSEISSSDAEDLKSQNLQDHEEMSAVSSMSSDVQEPYSRPGSGMSILNKRFSRKGSKISTCKGFKNFKKEILRNFQSTIITRN